MPVPAQRRERAWPGMLQGARGLLSYLCLMRSSAGTVSDTSTRDLALVLALGPPDDPAAMLGTPLMVPDSKSPPARAAPPCSSPPPPRAGCLPPF